jgi:hypothetical protein
MGTADVTDGKLILSPKVPFYDIHGRTRERRYSSVPNTTRDQTKRVEITYIHTHHSRFIPEGVAEVSMKDMLLLQRNIFHNAHAHKLN